MTIQSAILGTLGGVLLFGIIIAIVIASIVVLKRRKLQKGKTHLYRLV